MIIIPELEKVLILVPRAGSSSLKEAVLNRYPKAMMIYRHMEACGIPKGYERWSKVGVIRHPLQRLFSLYKYLQDFDGDYCPEYIERMNKSVKDIEFSDWIVNNEVQFTNPYSSKKYYPEYSVNHYLPENKKSQHYYLRPDLGTEIFRFDCLGSLAKTLDIDLGSLNGSKRKPFPVISLLAHKHMANFFSWDYRYF